YDLTYLMPNVPVKDYVEFARRGPYSPFFDTKLGNYVRQSNILNLIAEKAGEIERIKSNHKEIVAAYERVKLAFDEAQKELQAAEAAYSSLSKRLDTLNNRLLDASNEEEKAELRKALDEATKAKEKEGPEYNERLRTARKQFYRITPEYVEAKSVYDTAVPNIDILRTEIVSLVAIFETINSLSANNFAANERSLQAFETTTVGTATASYSIWSDEEARLRNVLSTYGRRESYFRNHSVARLPIHNIRLKKPQSISTQGSISGGLNGSTSISFASVGAKSDSLVVADGAQSTSYPIFTKDNQFVTPEMKTLSGDGAGTYSNLVTRGALCTGNSQARYNWPVKTVFNSGGHQSTIEFKVYGFKPRTSNVLAQSIALEYDYYVRSEPTGANCTLNINKFRSFVTDNGSSGFLFWRTSWSQAERQQIEQSGINCHILLSPNGENPDYKEQAKQVEALRQAMMQEIAAEFILTYAKQWDVSQRQGALPKNRDALVTAGNALESLCGTNVYCALASIALKSGDELFGSHADRIKNRDYLSGTIRRSYDETSWTLSFGQAVIDLFVSL
ncbi:MAG TPA: hypothetical protein VEL47_01685, partial [Myxococcota bacterium]|nr:hypothetical protein [Myxococcota bacterium]